MDLSSIQKRIIAIEKLEEENKINKEMLKNELESDNAYMEAANALKEAQTKKKLIKEEIIAIPANKELLDNINGNLEEITTSKEILTGELIQYYQAHKTDEITDAGGQLRKFKVSATLLPKRSFGDNTKE